MRAVLDSSVVVAGIGWRGDSRRVLGLLARAGFESCRTGDLSAEWFAAVEATAQDAAWKNPNWTNWLAWLAAASELVEPVIYDKSVSRDPNDDKVILAALSSRADFIVTYDNDLLALGKPFGIVCIPPRRFLSVVIENFPGA